MNELLKKLCQFVGYGSKDAKVIFIGIEEKTWDHDEAPYKRRLEIQGELKPFTDLAELCERLAVEKLYNPQKEKPQPCWAPLCSVMLGVEGKREQMDQRLSIVDYQLKRLGRIPGDSLLAELLPVPKSKSKSFEDMHSRLLGIPLIEGTHPLDAYRELVLAYRQKLLAEMIAERFRHSPPRLIVSYGRPWHRFEPIFQEVRQMLKEGGAMEYREDERPVKIDGRRIPRFKWGKIRGCLVVLTWHPAARDKWEPMKFNTSVAEEVVDIYWSGVR